MDPLRVVRVEANHKDRPETVISRFDDFQVYSSLKTMPTFMLLVMFVLVVIETTSSAAPIGPAPSGKDPDAESCASPSRSANTINLLKSELKPIAVPKYTSIIAAVVLGLHSPQVSPPIH
jgi:hypothetical protein